jgi:ATP-binding cassette subfamily F protein 3
MMKMISASVPFDGTVQLGHSVLPGYFEQDQEEKLDVNKTIYETVDDIAEGEIRKDLRSILGTFLFTGEEVDKKVGVLSGGERTRLALCQLLLSPCNFLILDEPTNHLDIQSKEVLKRALINYEGTFIVVSHDREFLDGLTNRIWDIQDKTLKIYHYDVKEYLAKKMTLESDEVKSDGATKVTANVAVQEVKKELSQEEQKEVKRKKNSLQNQIRKSEEQIEALENKVKAMDEVILHLDYSDKANSDKVLAEYDKIKKELDTVVSIWETQVEEMDAI